MEPIIERIKTFDDVTVSKTDVQSNMNMALQHGVSGVPTFLIFKDGFEVDRKVGARAHNEFEAWINEHRAVQSDVFSELSLASKDAGSPVLCDSSQQENSSA